MKIKVRTFGKWHYCNNKPLEVVDEFPRLGLIRCLVPTEKNGFDKDNKPKGKLINVDFKYSSIISEK